MRGTGRGFRAGIRQAIDRESVCDGGHRTLPWKLLGRLPVLIIGMVCILLAAPSLQASPTQHDKLEFFENKIRPLFAEHCVGCHGGKKQKGGLRLDSPGAILAGGDGGAVIVPGDRTGSRLIQAVQYLDDDLQMPPRKKLDAQQIEDLVRWVNGGAQLPEGTQASSQESSFDLEARKQHWSFQSLTQPAVPSSQSAWPRDAVDRFILDRLEREGLLPAPEAQASAWLRRVHFTLVGLPPDPETVRKFAKDSSPQARAALVDELLHSPHFGERWGRHWLDLMRYAETRGHEFDFVIPNAHQYRDYVVRAFNSDVPFDRFVQEHIAGDLLEEPRMSSAGEFDESLLGTGFWFLGDGAHSPVDIRADETDRVAGQVDVFSRAFLGLTVACARCHDHKFDPITDEDFYALSGFVMGGSYRQARFETQLIEQQVAQQLSELQTRYRPIFRSLIHGTLRDVVESRLPYQELARQYVDSLSAPEAEDQAGRTVDMQELERLAAEAELDATDLRAWVDEWILAADQLNHPLHGLLQTSPPARRIVTPAEPTTLFSHDKLDRPILLQDGFSAGESSLSTRTFLLGDNPKSAVTGVLGRPAVHFDPFWNRIESAAGDQVEPTATDGILPGRMFRTETFVLEQPELSVLVRGQGFVYAAVDGHRLIRGPLHGALCKSVHTGGSFQWMHLDLGDYVGHRVHLEFSPRQEAEPSFAVAGYQQGVVRKPELAWGPVDFVQMARNVGFNNQPSIDLALFDWVLQHPKLFPFRGPEYRAASAEYCRELGALTLPHELTSHTAPVMLEGSGVDENLLLRGNASTPGDVIPRRFLSALGEGNAAPIQQGSGRLELAKMVTSDSNPFLPRVWANRIWHHTFGRGIVASVDDFGAMGSPPSHPELLDHLAQALIQNGWSTKALLRRLVLSRTYAMSSALNADAQQVDPDNLLLHRMPVQRLDAEALRDTILAVSGTLDPTLFGPSIPVHLNEFSDGRGKPSASGPLDGAGRRSLYLSVRRNFPVPFLTVFDFPNPAATMGRRGNSNVPAQSLTLMNDPFVHQEAERWAQRLFAEDVFGEAARPVEEARLTSMYLSAFGRAPSAEEQSAGLDYLHARSAAGGTQQEAWTELCHVLINMKEFRYLP